MSLNAKIVERAALGKLELGTYSDGLGTGLILRVKKRGRKNYAFWSQRVMINGKRKDLGLGSPPIISLAMARQKAIENKRLITAGIDPLASKKAARNSITFKEAVEKYYEIKQKELRNAKSAMNWINSFHTHVLPNFGEINVEDITHRDILRILEPIWETKNASATKLRQRMEAVLSWATVSGFREGDNPARWKGNLAELLPKPSKVAKKEKQPALQQYDVARWWADLAKREGIGIKALQLMMLTGARTSEVLEMTWQELTLPTGDKTDLTDNTPPFTQNTPPLYADTAHSRPCIWIIPAARMGKTGKEHRIPLTSEMRDLLLSLPRGEPHDLVFPAPKGGKLSINTLRATMIRMHEANLARGGHGYIDPNIRNRKAVPHGLRSTFRDWALELGYDREMAEMQLSHSIGSEVERSYRRSDNVERRRAMMEAWGRFLRGEKTDTVVHIGGRR